MKPNTLIFGDKNKFAIEIEQGITEIKGYMKLWFKGISLGDKRRQSEFIHAVLDFRKFLKTISLLYEDSFIGMSLEEINTYVLAEDLIRSENPKELEEAERRQIYTRFLGDQFDGNCSFKSLYINEVITWIIWYYKRSTDEFKSFEITLEDYKTANIEFTNWFNLNLAQKYSRYKY